MHLCEHNLDIPDLDSEEIVADCPPPGNGENGRLAGLVKKIHVENSDKDYRRSETIWRIVTVHL